MNTINPQPGEAWLIDHNGNEEEAIRSVDTWRVGESSWRSDASKATPLRRLVPEPTEWETLRAAGDICESRWMRTTAKRLMGEADLLEAEHHHAQERAERDAERERLIEKVTGIIHGFDDSKNAARALADAGFLTDPETQA